MIFPKPLLLMVSLEHAPAARTAPAPHAALTRVIPAQILIARVPTCAPPQEWGTINQAKKQVNRH